MASRTDKGKVQLRCSGQGMGGLWEAKVEFRPLSKGYGVWQEEGYDQPGTAPRLVKVGGSKQVLSWRRVVKWLRDDRIAGLGGTDLAREVEVEGIAEVWKRELCAIAWVQYENDLEPFLERLLGLSDEEISLYRELLGPLTDEGAPSKLSELDDALAPLSLNVSPLSRVLSELHWTSGMDWIDLIERAAQLGEVCSLAKESGFAIGSLAEISSAAGFGDAPSTEQLLKRLNETAEEADARAQVEQNLRVEDLLTSAASGAGWSKALLEESFQIEGRFPQRFAEDALVTWTELSEKPLEEQDGSEDWPSLDVLSWILGGFDAETLSDFCIRHSDELELIIDWTKRLRSKQEAELGCAERMSGGFINGPEKYRQINAVRAGLENTAHVLDRLTTATDATVVEDS